MDELQREHSGASEHIDFSDGLGSEFGVEDTTIIGKNQLDSFLFNEPITNSDLDDIQKVENQSAENVKPTPKTSDKNKEVVKEEDQVKKEDLGKTLKNWLESEDSNESENEEPIKNKEVKSEEDKSVDESTESEDENQFVTLSRDLYKLGVFTADEEDGEEVIATTPEEFLERFQIEKKKGAMDMVENFLDRFGDDYKKMFESVFVKGVDPKEYLASFTKIQAVKDLDLSSETNQEKIFVEYYRSQGLSEERIQKRLEKAKDYGDLADEAVELHELLVQKEEKEQARLEVEKQEDLRRKQAKEAEYQQNVNRILQTKLQSGDFDGIPVNKKEAQDAFYYMTNKPYKLPNGELITEMQKDWLELDRPENHELKVKVALLLKNKMDLSKVQKKAVSNKTDSLFTSLTNKKTANTRKESTSTAPKSFFS